jgi:hypothetical protein
MTILPKDSPSLRATSKGGPSYLHGSPRLAKIPWQRVTRPRAQLSAAWQAARFFYFYFLQPFFLFFEGPCM